MIAKFKELIMNYLYGNIDKPIFIQSCEKLYIQTIDDFEKNFELDAIKVIPFIHELAYCRYTDAELENQVKYVLAILNGTQEYYYSAFFRLIPPDKSNALFGLYKKYDFIKLMDLYPIFTERIGMPQTINDILYNSIYDILLNLNMSCVEESEFNYVNCYENVSYNQIEKRVLLLLSYFLGLEDFLLQITYLPTGSVFYTIT